jgi:hypothetical protein
MANDVFAGLVRLFADAGHEVATTLGDRDSRESLMARAGLTAPVGAPPSPQGSARELDTLRTRAAGAQEGGGDSLVLIRELSNAMITLVAFVQQAASSDSEDDAWNALATFLDLIAVDRLRRKDPATLALLQALHLISDDRLLFADLIRARDRWGSFVLGHPASDDAKADNWSLILAAALAVLGNWIPSEDDAGRPWRVDILFGWDPDPSPAHPRAARVLQRMATARLTRRDTLEGVGISEQVGISSVVVPPAAGGWGVFLGLDLGGGLKFRIDSHLELVLESDAPNAVDAFFGDPPFALAAGAGTSARLLLRRKQEVAENWILGREQAVHLEIGTFLTAIEVGDPTRFRLHVGDGALVLPREALGFLGSVLPSDGAKFTFDIDLMVDAHGRLSLAGGAGMTVTVPVNESIAGVTVRSVTVALAIETGPKGEGASLGATVAFGVAFGEAFRVTVDGIGGKLIWVLPSSPTAADGGAPIVRGNLGPAGDLSLDFIAPRGIGIVINVGPLKGGGFLFFDPPHRTYGGALEASLRLCDKGIQIKAAGLLRETDEGWSFVLIVSAQIDPPIEIFLGLTLNGVGGMVGVNVGVDIDKLRAGLNDGAVGRLLFPDDPVANAPAIIETMAGVFPPRQGGWVAGPMLQLGWGRADSFVRLSVGLVVAFPSPTLLVILGKLELVVPTRDLGIVDVKAEFLGVISWEKPSVSFDASLVDSKVAAFPLTGDMAMRASSQGFILAIGGFHPRFTPPETLPELRRVGIDISANPITKIRAEAYLAVTSNTFQIGLHAALDIEAGPASIHGWLDFDALVQWEPRFHFSIHFDIGLELRVFGETMAGISVDLLLEGPGPWHAKGNATIHLLFFTVHAGFEATWGEVEPAEARPEIDVSAQVAQSLSAEGAWAAIAPAGDALVTLRAVDRQEIAVHPYGQLSARQQVVPLGVPVTHIGRSRVRGGSATVVVTPIAGAPASTPTMGQFASAQTQDLTDDEKLSRPSFELFQDGIAFGAAQMATSAEHVSTVSYETVFIPDERSRLDHLDLSLLAHALKAGAIARSRLHTAKLHDGPDQRVRLFDESYRVVVADTLATSVAAPATFGSATEAYAVAKAAGDRVVVVGAHEAVA